MIKETIKMYSDEEFDADSICFETHNFENHKLIINDQLFFDTLLTMIRGETISYTSMRNKTFIQSEKKLETDIQKLERDLSNTVNEKNILEELEYKKASLEDLRKQKINDAMLRSKLNWMEFGEKPSKFFLNLQKQNFVNRQMKKLVDDKGKLIQDKSILIETYNFYSKLYQKKNQVEAVDWNDLAHLNVPKLNTQLKDSLEGPLLMDEVFEVIKNMKNNKSPGLDGFTVEFIKFFWNYLKYFLVRSLNYAFLNGNMSYTQKIGIITLIPKGNKDRQYLRNWRPISLLNVLYKIASSCIANRIKKTLSILIHESQKGFMPGRFIGENIRLLYDIMMYTDINDIPGLLLLIDFEKAFDSISHEFIMQVLDFFNFGTSIKSWVKLFYEDAFSCVLVNGHLTNRFKIERGCRQGDPLSPYIFLLCAEILNILVRKSTINGLIIRNVQHKIIQYADDTLITLDGSKEDLQEVLRILDKFSSISGLNINKQKTKVIWIGKNKHRKDHIWVQETLDWVFEGYFRYLGIDFSHDLFEMVQYNYSEKIKQIKDHMSLWLKRSLIVLGRITVVKSLLVSKLNYLFLSLPNPTNEMMKEIERSLYKFIWEGKPDKISRMQMCQPYHLGGAKMINIHLHAQSLKMSWMRRLFNGTIDSYLYFIMNSFLPDNLQFNVCFGNDHYRQMARVTPNPFWKDVFLIYSKLQSTAITNVACQPLWKNDFIKVNNACMLYKSWYKKGIIVINDLLENDGNFLSFNSFKVKFDVTVNFLQYFGICKAIKSGYNIQTTINKMEQPLRPDTIALICKYSKGCSHIYSLFQANEKKESKSLRKWKIHFNIDDRIWQTYCNINFSSTIDVDLRWFQYKVMHRILFTNVLLFKLKLVEDDLCSFCHMHTETLIHFFCDCKFSINIWSELEKWILTNTGYKINFTKENILFGFQGANNKAMNCLTFIVKRTLYNNKLQNKVPYFPQVKISLINYYKKEKYIAETNCLYGNFQKKWTSLKRLLDK